MIALAHAVVAAQVGNELTQRVRGGRNLIRAGTKDEDVTSLGPYLASRDGLLRMEPQHELERGLDEAMRRACLGCVVHGDGEAPPSHAKYWCAVKVRLQPRSVEGCRRHDHTLQARALCGRHGDRISRRGKVATARQHTLCERKEHVRVERALMCLIENERIIWLERWLGNGLSEKDAVCRKGDFRLVCGGIIEAHGVAHVRANTAAHFLCNALCSCDCRNAPRLCDTYSSEACIEQKARKMRRFP